MSKFFAITVDRNSGSNDFWAVADALGLRFIAAGRDWLNNGLAGDTYSIREQLKASGFRWNGEAKAWMSDDLAAYKKLVA